MTGALPITNVKKNEIIIPFWIASCYLIAFGLEFVSLFIEIKSGLAFGIYAILVFVYVFCFTKTTLNVMDAVVSIFFLYNLLSIFFTVVYGERIETFLGEFCAGLLPISFYFVARHSNRNFEKQFFKCLLIGTLIVDLIGLYFYFAQPTIYIQYLQKTVAFFDIRWSLNTPMLESFIGASVVGALSNISIAYCMHYLLLEKNAKHRVLVLLCLLFYFLTVILTLERVSWVCSALTVIVYLLIASKHKIRDLAVLSLLVSIVVIIILNHPSASTLILNRIEGSDSIFSERSANWFKVFQQDTFKLFFGNGLGTCGHRSEVGLRIVDGNYFKMIYEVGLFGTFIFLSIVLSSIVFGFKYIKRAKQSYFMLYLAIVFIIAIQGIGASAFTFQDEMPVFWFSIGMIFTDKERFKKGLRNYL